MPAHTRIVLACCLALCGIDAAGAESSTPESREYKLMLAPGRFDVGDPGKSANELWGEIRRIIASRLDKRDNGKPRHSGSFDDSKQRQIVFFDTADCVLTRNGYALRERTKIKKGNLDNDSREATLKFRSPDFIIALDARSDEGKVKFEEDIGPQLVRTVGADGKEGAALARPPAMRSQFSVSITHDREPGDRFGTFGDATDVYPELKDGLKKAGVSAPGINTELLSGERFHELVFEGASVDLGKKSDAEFDLSLWYKRGTFGSAAPEIAELSFKYSVADAAAAGATARRALTLFTQLQERLGDWAASDQATKTSLALPDACR